MYPDWRGALGCLARSWGRRVRNPDSTPPRPRCWEVQRTCTGRQGDHCLANNCQSPQMQAGEARTMEWNSSSSSKDRRWLASSDSNQGSGWVQGEMRGRAASSASEGEGADLVEGGGAAGRRRSPASRAHRGGRQASRPPTISLLLWSSDSRLSLSLPSRRDGL